MIYHPKFIKFAVLTSVLISSILVSRQALSSSFHTENQLSNADRDKFKDLLKEQNKRKSQSKTRNDYKINEDVERNRIHYHYKSNPVSVLKSKTGEMISALSYQKRTEGMFKKSDHVHINLLLAHPEAKGAGSQLLAKTIEQEVNNSKHSKVKISLDSLNNTDLKSFYNKFGFKESKKDSGDYTTRRMTLKLDKNSPDYKSKMDLIGGYSNSPVVISPSSNLENPTSHLESR